MRLPIDQIREEFERSLDGSSRLVLTAETGAGKSTQVPVWLAERFAGLVLVVEPRRVACNALAEFLSAQRGEAAGGYFGSRVRFSDRSSDATRVLFCTPGVALRMLAGSEVPGAIVVDEFHERSWQMDLVVAAAASLARFQSVPLILTSATIDAESAAATLGAATLHATGRTFPVDVLYDQSCDGPSDHEIGARVGDAVVQALQEHVGDVLVFLPGLKEIRAAESMLRRRQEEILIVHGTQTPEAMRRVFQSSNRRRVYLSTNVAETSITLPGVRVVIDSGLAKTRLHRAGRAVLATVPISDASMQQRAGRAGRVAAGVCIRLWSESYRPEPHPRPEIERVELDDLLLQAAELGLVDEAFTKANWIAPPPDFAVERALQRLEGLAAIDGEGLTERGRKLAELPVSTEEAALLVGAPAAIDATLCDLVAILQSRGTFLRPLNDLRADDRDDVEDARADLLEGVADEVTTNLKLLREGVATKHHLSRRRLDEARSISRQLRELTGASGESSEGLAEYILGCLPAAGFVKRPRASKKKEARSVPWANGSLEVKVFPFSPVDPDTEAWKSDAAVILETEWLGGATGVFGIGRMLLPCEPEVLAKAGLGESEIVDACLERKSRGRIKVFADRKVRLAGVTLASGEVELSGGDLHRAVAGFVLENRLFKGAGAALREALHGWRLVANWRGEPLSEYERSGGAVPDDEAAWLVQRLATLGVESAEDLELVDASDLLPDLEAETGIPKWVLEPILEAFPQVWKNQGGTYSCTVLPETRTVQMEPIDGKAKKLKEPPAWALPGFCGFRVKYKQGSRWLTLR